LNVYKAEIRGVYKKLARRIFGAKRKLLSEEFNKLYCAA
jgi:hypothetical protein